MKLEKKIGAGGFANVFLGNKNNKPVAIKIANDVLSKEDAIKYAKYEIEILKKFKNSKNIINLIDYRINKTDNYIITELLGNELYTLIRHYRKNGTNVPLDIVKCILKQILRGLISLKSHDVLHNDLKVENILITKPLPPVFLYKTKTMIKLINKVLLKTEASDPQIAHYRMYTNVLKHLLLLNIQVKIIDFGNAYTKVIAKREYEEFSSSRPTRHYISPEILIGHEHWVESDMWSFGCIAYELMTNRVLFNPYRDNNMGVNSMHLASIINVFNKQFPKSILECGKKSKKYFINSKHRFDYLIKKNSPLEYLLEFHNIPANETYKIKDFLLPIFELDPAKRIAPDECLKSSWLYN
jgi:serine/threonine protein kinase